LAAKENRKSSRSPGKQPGKPARQARPGKAAASKSKNTKAASGQSSGKSGGSRSASQVRVRRAAGEEAWELVHPRCACDREDDVAEVRKMIDAGEVEIAVDELRWLLGGCSDFIDAHKTLGELALLDGDVPLARGHFGYAYRLGSKAIEQAGIRGPLPYRLPANQAFHEAGKGLAYCLKQLEKPEMLQEVVELLLACDPADPLGVGGFLTGDNGASGCGG
jgi:hypothetical protein